MSRYIEVAPSILSADFSKLGEEIQAIDTAGADLIHMDVMDGHFVPNITFGPQVIKSLRPLTNLPFDVHLMISPVDLFIESFVDAGADIITIHAESGAHLHRTLQLIKSYSVQVGISFNPSSDVNLLPYVLDLIDQVLIMTVNPGFGGQKFIMSQLQKIEKVRKIIDDSGKTVVLEVDGGINPETASQAIAAGATRLVAGTSVFSGGTSKYQNNIKTLKDLN